MLGKLRAVPGTSTALLLPYSIGQGNQRPRTQLPFAKIQDSVKITLQKTRGMGEVVAAIFGKYSLPHFLSHSFSFPCLQLFQKALCFGNDPLYEAIAQH